MTDIYTEIRRQAVKAAKNCNVSADRIEQMMLRAHEKLSAQISEFHAQIRAENAERRRAEFKVVK